MTMFVPDLMKSDIIDYTPKHTKNQNQKNKTESGAPHLVELAVKPSVLIHTARPMAPTIAQTMARTMATCGFTQ